MKRLVTWSATLLGLLTVVLSGLALTLVELNGRDLSTAETTGSAVLALSFVLVGAIVVVRRPTNVIGWILLTSGTFNGLNAFAAEYPSYALVTNPRSALPAAPFVAWLSSWVWTVGAAGFSLILWLFPTGRPPRRWGWLVWPISVGAGLAMLPMSVAAWRVRESAVLAGGLPDQVISGLPKTLATLGIVLLGLSLVAALISAVVRFRRAQADERQQQKWLFSAGLLTMVTIALGSPASPFEFRGAWREIIGWAAVIALPSIPAAIAIAILRYRLYDIDRIINRTVVYGVVVALLAGVYGVLVVGVPTVVRGLGDSDLLVAGATLAAFFLFAPLRRRVQRVVDRRFYRSRYDAQQVVEGFSARLRDEVDLGAITGQLAGVVQETIRPESVAVWVREETT